jgi:acetoin utilization deacetylase AcuC-like enzyme
VHQPDATDDLLPCAHFCGAKRTTGLANPEHFGLQVNALRSCYLMFACNAGQTAQVVEPKELSIDRLRDVHTKTYLAKLHRSSIRVASMIELPPLAILPMILIQRLLLRKMRTHVAGTILAVGLAAAKGSAVNVGGGMHHASYNDGAPPASPNSARGMYSAS